MINEYASNLAEQMGITLSQVIVIDGKLLGCRDSHLLQLHSDGHVESALIFQRELEDLQNGICHDRLEARLRVTLSRLQKLLGLENRP